MLLLTVMADAVYVIFCVLVFVYFSHVVLPVLFLLLFPSYVTKTVLFPSYVTKTVFCCLCNCNMLFIHAVVE